MATAGEMNNMDLRWLPELIRELNLLSNGRFYCVVAIFALFLLVVAVLMAVRLFK